MATLKEFEEALRQAGMGNALAILDGLKKRDREQRSIAPARRVVGRKMTAELAKSILDMHAATAMTQQEIAFKLGVNQGRVNEVIKRGKWLTANPHAPEALSRDKAMDRLTQRAKARRADHPKVAAHLPLPVAPLSRSSAPPVHSIVRPETVKSVAKPERTAPVVRAASAKPAIISAQLAFLDL